MCSFRTLHNTHYEVLNSLINVVSQEDQLEHFTVRLPSELFRRMESKRKDLHRTRTSFVTIAIEEYINKLNSGVAEPAPKYTAEQFKEAETDDALRAEILMNAPNPYFRVLFAEIQEAKKKKNK